MLTKILQWSYLRKKYQCKAYLKPSFVQCVGFFSLEFYKYIQNVINYNLQNKEGCLNQNMNSTYRGKKCLHYRSLGSFVSKMK